MIKPAFILKNLFSDEEIQNIRDTIFNQSSQREVINLEMPTDIDDNTNKIYSLMGRLDVEKLKFERLIINKIEKTLNELYPNKKFYIGNKNIISSTYSGLYGKPGLSEHKDGGFPFQIIVDYQLDSNTSWNIKVDGEEYEIENNDALVFDPVISSHSRPQKSFNPEDYVTMIYFRGRVEEKK
jgi:hypothetical protein